MNYLSRFWNWWAGQWRGTTRLGKIAMLVVPLFLGCCGITMFSALVSPNEEPAPEAAVVSERSATIDATADEPATDEPTQLPPTATVQASATPRPSSTTEPTLALFAESGAMEIVEVNEAEEYIDIRNVAGTDVMLTDWALRLEGLDRTCYLGGVGLFPDGYILRVWLGEQAPAAGEYACGFDSGILNESGPQLIRLLDPDFNEVATMTTIGASRGSTIELPTAAPAQPTVASATQAPAATPTAAIQAPGDVVISYIFFNGVVAQVESDEYAEITNRGGTPVNIGGWRLNAGEPDQNFTFPSFDLQPGQSCRVYTNELHPESCGFTLGRNDAIWRNSGDCGALFDTSGAEVSRYCF